jgi:hypothetical protein
VIFEAAIPMFEPRKPRECKQKIHTRFYVENVSEVSSWKIGEEVIESTELGLWEMGYCELGNAGGRDSF